MGWSNGMKGTMGGSNRMKQTMGSLSDRTKEQWDDWLLISIKISGITDLAASRKILTNFS